MVVLNHASDQCFETSALRDLAKLRNRCCVKLIPLLKGPVQMPVSPWRGFQQWTQGHHHGHSGLCLVTKHSKMVWHIPLITIIHIMCDLCHTWTSLCCPCALISLGHPTACHCCVFWITVGKFSAQLIGSNSKPCRVSEIATLTQRLALP